MSYLGPYVVFSNMPLRAGCECDSVYARDVDQRTPVSVARNSKRHQDDGQKAE